MVPVASLWLPILVSAVIVFLASWIVHMFLPYHRSDFVRLPQEDAVLDALRSLNIPTGQYLAPYANIAAQMQQPEYVKKRCWHRSVYGICPRPPAPVDLVPPEMERDRQVRSGWADLCTIDGGSLWLALAEVVRPEALDISLIFLGEVHVCRGHLYNPRRLDLSPTRADDWLR